MPETTLTVNGKRKVVAADPQTPLLWVLRDHLNLTGTKYGCGIGQCGACTVILDGNAVRSCQVLLSRTADKSITTIEGLSPDRCHPVQQAWLMEQVPQCGYCQSGQIMAATVLLSANPNPNDTEIDDALSGTCAAAEPIIAFDELCIAPRNLLAGRRVRRRVNRDMD